MPDNSDKGKVETKTLNKVGIVCCSNGQSEEGKPDILKLEEVLQELGICPVFSKHIYAKDTVFSGTARERAEALMEFYRDEKITAVYDVSGGDIANEILPYLDYDVIAKSKKRFWGYSDLTTVINAIYAKTGQPSVLYQMKNLVWDETGKQRERFETEELFLPKYEFLQGEEMEGVLVGGNIRCLLKLAGTEYFPDMQDKILVLEAMSGLAPQITTYLNQLKQLGVFKKIRGIFLGTFLEMERTNVKPTVEDMVLDMIGSELPVAKTYEVGHGRDSKALVIGESIRFSESR